MVHASSAPHFGGADNSARRCGCSLLIGGRLRTERLDDLLPVAGKAWEIFQARPLLKQPHPSRGSLCVCIDRTRTILLHRGTVGVRPPTRDQAVVAKALEERQARVVVQRVRAAARGLFFSAEQVIESG